MAGKMVLFSHPSHSPQASWGTEATREHQHFFKMQVYPASEGRNHCTGLGVWLEWKSAGLASPRPLSAKSGGSHRFRWNSNY
jgi:hypothetical protein